MVTCAGSISEDVTLLDRVRDRLDQCGHASMRAVSCSVEGGRIRLAGRTRTYYLKQLAQEIARATPGASDIVNDILVRSTDKAS